MFAPVVPSKMWMRSGTSAKRRLSPSRWRASLPTLTNKSVSPSLSPRNRSDPTGSTLLFSVVYQDIILGEALEKAAAHLADLSPRVIVLVADAETLAERDRKRAKTGYSQDFPPQVLADAVARNTLSTALTIDTSRMEVDAVVDRILAE